MTTSEDVVRDTVIIRLDGRSTITKKIRKVVGLIDKEAYCQIENFGKDKILFTILNRFEPPKANQGIRSKIRSMGEQ